MATSDIFNFIVISDRIATGGQPTREQLEAARDEGYEAVINLAPSDAENFALADEERVLAELGLDYHHIPVIWTDPRPQQFDAFCTAMEQVAGSKVLIHCAANYRVTAFFSSYALRHLGWSTEQADALVSRIWESDPRYAMDDTWRAYIAAIRAT
jgi:uncharacterized protein (TIGR01244 family)